MKKIFDRVSHWKDKARPGGSTVSKDAKSSNVDNDNSQFMILSAARALHDAIQAILSDGASLSGDDMSGFVRLVELIESEPQQEDTNIFIQGSGALSMLLKYIEHPTFVEGCSSVGLAPSLLHALRLLRMMEVKHGQLHTTSLTEDASSRVCCLLATLCAHTQTIEQLRPSLTKLLCLPLSPLPETGMHFQEDVTSIIRSMCKSALTSQLVWYLRDCQAIYHMVRSLRDLTALSTDRPPDKLLRGMAAEEKNAWIVAAECIVELLNAADAFSNVLLGDLESSGGFETLQHMLYHTSTQRSMKMTHIISRLLIGESRESDKPLVHPTVGGVFSGLLMKVLHLDRSIHGDESIEGLVAICDEIVEKNVEWFDKEHLLLQLAYSLLTIYSEHPQNYSIVEQSFCLLPTLVLCLPAYRNEETSSSVLKTFNFVCAECTPTFSVIALCAAISVMVKHAINVNCSNDILLGYQAKLTHMLEFFADIMRRDEKYALVFMRCGLKLILCAPLENAESFPDGFDIPKQALPVFQQLISLVVVALKDHPCVATDVKQSGLTQLIRTLICNDGVDAQFSSYILSILEQLALSEMDNAEQNVIAIIDLLIILKGKYVKCGQILDCLYRILCSDALVISNVWQVVSGFDHIVGLLNTLEGVFSQTADEGVMADAFNCLRSALKCIAIALTSQPQNSILDNMNTNRIFFRENVKYPTLTKALYQSGVFTTKYADECVKVLFYLVNGCSETPIILNPDAVAVILDVLPYLSDQAAFQTIQLIKDHAFSQIDGCQQLSEAGIMRLFVEKFQSNLRDASHPLRPPLTSLLITLCSEYLTLVDFNAILQNLVRPDAIVSLKTNKLLPPWETVEKKGIVSQRTWDGVQMLIDLAEASARSKGVSFVSLGPGASRNSGKIAHVHTQWIESLTGRPFPAASFTFSCWAQLGDPVRRPTAAGAGKEKRIGTVPLFSLSTPVGGFLEVQFDVFTSQGRLLLRGKGKAPTVYSFNVPYISEHEWHLIVVTLKRPKRVVTSNKASVSIFFDGQSVFADKVEYEVPAQAQTTDIVVGKSTIGVDASTIDYLRIWHLGPMHMFEDAFTQIQVSRIMTKGPAYNGTFQGESPLEDSLPSLVADMLCKCNSMFLDMNALMESLGLKGMEMVVVPLMEPINDGVVSFDMPVLPPPILSYCASSISKIVQRQSVSNMAEANKSNSKLIMHNAASDFSILPIAVLVNGWHVSRVDSIARCVGALGGPKVLFPLVQVASTEAQLVVSLNLIRECIRSDTSNLKYMHVSGFQILGFLLSRKPKDLITEVVIDELLSMCVDRGLKSTNSSFSVLLVDTLALYQLVLNHQIWDIKRFNFAMYVTEHLRVLVSEDARHATLNAKRLSLLGVVRWVLLLMVFGVERSVNANKLETESPKTWQIRCRSVEEAASSKDPRDPYLLSSFVLLRALMVAHLRQSDIDEIAQIILRSLVSSAPQGRRRSSTSADTAPNSTDTLNVGGNFELTPTISFRVGLLRFLRELYLAHVDAEEPHYTTGSSKTSASFSNSFDKQRVLTEPELHAIFSGALMPRWFLLVLEKSVDYATTSFTLRLLGTMLQKDVLFRRAFCAIDGFKAIHSFLTVEPQSMAVLLPLLALLYRIPMKFMPMSSDVTIQKITDIIEKCPGPISSDPDFTEFTIPILNIILGCYTTLARSTPTGTTCPQTELLSAILNQSINNANFRDLLQQKAAIEIIIAAMLRCSSAYDEYGSHIFTESDLVTSIQEDYITIDIAEPDAPPGSPLSPGRSRYITDPQEIDNFSEVVLLEPEGSVLINFISRIITDAITKYRSPHVIAYFLISFPKHILESFVCGYHALLFEKLRKVIRVVIDEMDLESLQAASYVFAYLVPMAKARLIYDGVLFEILKLSLYALEALTSTEASNWLGLEKHHVFLKDIGCSARYFAILNLHSVFHTSDGWARRLVTIKTIRSHMHLLCNPLFDEMLESSFPKTKGDEKKSPIALLESFNYPIGGAEMLWLKKTQSAAETALSLSLTEKSKLSQAFSIVLLSNSYLLFLEDDSAIRVEAMRLCAALLIHRKAFMAELLTPALPKKRLGDDDVAEIEPSLLDGFVKLVPETPGATTSYSKYLRDVNVQEIDGEEARFAEFSYWLTDKGNKCEALVGAIDFAVASYMPSGATTIASIKEVLILKSKLDTYDDVSHTFWLDEHQRQVELVGVQIRQWLVYGVAENAAGGNLWKALWCSLQSSPTWGSMPTNIRADSSARNEEYSSMLTYTPISTEEEVNATITWRLDSSECPEKMRRRMEQDYDSALVIITEAETVGEATMQPADIVEPNVLADSSENVEEFLRQIQLFRKVANSKDDADDIEPVAVEVDEFEEQSVDTEDEEDVNEHTPDAPGDLPSSSVAGSGSLGKSMERGESFMETKRLTVKLSAGILSVAMGAFPEVVKAAAQKAIRRDGEDPEDPQEAPTSRQTIITTNSTQIAVPVSRYIPPSVDEEATRRGYLLNEMVRGLIGSEEWHTGMMFNISRVMGLEAQNALLVITSNAVHILDGFQLKHSADNERILEWSQLVSQHVTSAEHNAVVDAPKKSGQNRKNRGGWIAGNEEEAQWLDKIWYQLLHVDFGYQRMSVDQIYTIFRRRYQLQNTALEITDATGLSFLFACRSVQDTEQVLKKLLENDLPRSIFHRSGIKNIQIAGGLFMHKRLMAHFLSHVTNLWQKGCISNFEYLMHLNDAAGRSFQDLTQYPVFPWILCDYESESLDLSNPNIYRDLSRPMGALGEKRAEQYMERYKTMDEFRKEGMVDSPPPFFYGTHYSCAGYVLHYLMRIQPYSRMAISLQGGQFDKPDRLFKGIGQSWLSASQENLQDVRELIPEFYFLPDYLRNSNNFEFGLTQKGERVDDVILPPWAGNDPHEFVRKHREALESKYVSDNLHNWIDLVFGYKQRGPAAESAMNVFIHLTYDGEVDIDAITDPMLREATIAQINNFGQTPARLFNKPHPKRQVPEIIKRTQDGVGIDSAALQWHEHMYPSLCVVGAPNVVWLTRLTYNQVTYPNNIRGAPVGDARILSRDRVLAVPSGCLLVPPKFVKFIRFGKPSGGISLHVAQSSPRLNDSYQDIVDTCRHLDADREVSCHEQLHYRAVSCIASTREGDMIATGKNIMRIFFKFNVELGSEDRSVRTWIFRKDASMSGRVRKLEHHATFCGHTGTILSVDISMEFSIAVSGSEDRTAMVWDIQRMKLLRVLGRHLGPVISVSINNVCGYLATLTSTELRLYTINGELLCSANTNDVSNPKPRARVVLCMPVGEWQDGIVCVTGHETGLICLWKVRTFRSGDTLTRELVSHCPVKTHRADITSLQLSASSPSKGRQLIPRTYEGECAYELVVGDADGYVSTWAPARLDQLPQNELLQLLPKEKSSQSKTSYDDSNMSS